MEKNGQVTINMGIFEKNAENVSRNTGIVPLSFFLSFKSKKYGCPKIFEKMLNRGIFGKL